MDMTNVREMTRKPVAKLTIHDNSGRTICNAAEINARVTEHFSSQFSDPSVDGLNAFTETLSRLTHRITPAEIKRAIGKLNSGRASGHDDMRPKRSGRVFAGMPTGSTKSGA